MKPKICLILAILVSASVFSASNIINKPPQINKQFHKIHKPGKIHNPPKIRKGIFSHNDRHIDKNGKIIEGLHTHQHVAACAVITSYDDEKIKPVKKESKK